MAHHRTLIRSAALATTVLSLAVAGPAAADSIVYEKGSNVWIANPDGSGQYQVTTGGTSSRPYGSPSQADDGTIVAAHGNEIVRLRQNGAELSRFDPPGTTDSAGQPIDGVPQDLAVSPDGSKVAFSYYQYGCPPGAPCGARTVLLYSSSSAATPVAQYGKQFRRNASWVSNDRILDFGGYLSQVNVDSPGGGDDDDQHWFDDQDLHSPSTDLGDGELSRQGDRLVTLRNYGADLHMQFYAVTGNLQSGPPPAAPAEACYSGADASLDNPTWSPDGRAVAFAIAAGIEVMPLPNVTPGSCDGASSSTLVLPGGANPDWGPVGVNPGPRQSTAPGTGNGNGNGTAPSKPGVKAAPRKASCKTLKGVARDRCVHRAALASCRKAATKRKRKLCVRKADRALALKSCARKPKAKRAACVRKAKRAGSARVASASASFQTGKFKVELEGVQTTRWDTKHVKQFDCDVNIDGSGTEKVRFNAKPAVVTISRFGSSTPILMIGRKQAILDLRSRITRDGVMETSGGKVCSYGDGTGGAAPARDCGTKRGELTAELTYDSSRPSTIGLEQTLVLPLETFRNCPSGGTSWPSLLDREVAKSRMIGQKLPVADLFSHGKNIVIARGREVVAAAESNSTTTIRWTLSLTRIDKKG